MFKTSVKCPHIWHWHKPVRLHMFGRTQICPKLSFTLIFSSLGTDLSSTAANFLLYTAWAGYIRPNALPVLISPLALSWLSLVTTNNWISSAFTCYWTNWLSANFMEIGMKSLLSLSLSVLFFCSVATQNCSPKTGAGMTQAQLLHLSGSGADSETSIS